MEQLFAVRVLVHYHDKSSVDHAAVRRLLSAAGVDSLSVLLTDGTSSRLGTYIQMKISERDPIADVLGSSGSSLTQVASIFMLAEARAAADALPSSPQELETACSALERLLGCLATRPPLLPVRDIKQSARVKFGTAARRRAMHRVSGPRSTANAQEVSILKAVNAVLRLCDVATHCLAVVARQCVASKESSETAVALSIRLLTLAASLHEVQKVDTTPALSFSSSNSLRTALVAGAMHLGAIAVEHLEIEPMTWIHIANRIVMSSSTSLAPRTSVLSALFGGMIMAGKRYESCERDTKAAEGAVCMLSTLHVVLETGIIRGYQQGVQHVEESNNSQDSTRQAILNSSSIMSVGTRAISQAARSFLGERVVAAEEDGDEGRIATRTVYQACEEYAGRAGESEGMMGLLSRIFAAAGRQCRLETVDETLVSVSEGILTCQPDESDTSSEGNQMRPHSPPFALDVFDQKFKDAFGGGTTGGSNSEVGGGSAERLELHREIGALALDTLAHWVNRANSSEQHEVYDVISFNVALCSSASLFSLSESSASYDLRAAMVDYGVLVGPILNLATYKRQESHGISGWNLVVDEFVSSCRSANPILKNILSFDRSPAVVVSLLISFLQESERVEISAEPRAEDRQGMPVESLLLLIVSLICKENSFRVIGKLVDSIKASDHAEVSLCRRAALLFILHYAMLKALDVPCSDASRVAICSLYNAEGGRSFDPCLPPLFPEHGPGRRNVAFSTREGGHVNELLGPVHSALKYMDKWLFLPSEKSWRDLSRQVVGITRMPVDSKISMECVHKQAKLLYHVYWSCLLTHEALNSCGGGSAVQFSGLFLSNENVEDCLPAGPFTCMSAILFRERNRRICDVFRREESSSLSSLYPAECLALLHPQAGNRADDTAAYSQESLPLLLCAMVKSALAMISDHLCRDAGTAFRTFVANFWSENNIYTPTPAGRTNGYYRDQFNSNMSADQCQFAILQLAMCYARHIGQGRVIDLLSDAIVSATDIIPVLSREQLKEIRHLLLDVSSLLLFVSDANHRLRLVMSTFTRTLLVHSVALEEGFANATILLLVRVMGLSKAVDLGSSSSAAMHLCCSTALELTKDGSDVGDLMSVLSPSQNVPDGYGADFLDWFRSCYRTISLQKLLSGLLVFSDESAVTVSAHAESLSVLIEACCKSEYWQCAVITGLDDLMCSEEGFSQQLVRKSIMESATMNRSILAMFENVVGASSHPSASRIIAIAFEAAYTLFECTREVGLESKIRLLGFAVRLTIMYRRLLRLQRIQHMQKALEPALLRLILESLRTTMEALDCNPDEHEKSRFVMFLSGLVDCFLVGIYREPPSFTTALEEVSSANDSDCELKGEKKDASTTQEEDSVIGNQGRWEASRSEKDGSLPLCTYTTTGSQFIEQHWYFCYSCDLAGSEGVCSVCAQVCHDGCELAYSKFSRFFCDCGAGSDPQQETVSNAMSASEDGECGAAPNAQTQLSAAIQTGKRKVCQCLKRSRQGGAEMKSNEVEIKSEDPEPDSSPDDLFVDNRLRNLLLSELNSLGDVDSHGSKDEEVRFRESIHHIMQASSAVKCLTRTARFLVRSLDSVRNRHMPVTSFLCLSEIPRKFSLLQESPASLRSTKVSRLAMSTRIFSSGCLDTRPEVAAMEIGSLVSYNSVAKVMAVASKSSYIEFFGAVDVFCQIDTPLEKAPAPFYPRVSIPFGVAEVQFHPDNANLLLVSGKERIVILSRSHQDGSGSWISREVQLGLKEFEGSSEKNPLLKVSWVEGGVAHILVTTAQFVKIFNVANDTFCPIFFARIPKENNCTGDKGEFTSPDIIDTSSTKEVAKRKIVSALVIREMSGDPDEPTFYVLLLCSDKQMYVTHCPQKVSQYPVFQLVHSFGTADCSTSTLGGISGLSYHPVGSFLCVAFENGHLLCASLVLRLTEKELQAAIPFVALYNDAIISGSGHEFRPVPGLDASFFFYQKGKSLKSGGVFKIDANKQMSVQEFSGSPSASIIGLSTFASSVLLGEPARSGCLVALDDGSLYRIDSFQGKARPQLPERVILSRITNRPQHRSSREGRSVDGSTTRFCDVPETVGFFERCRLVADQVTIENADGLRSIENSSERMTVTLAGGGSECIVSSVENMPLKFFATVQNRSIVLVGARLRFGGTDRSRNRIPVEVKVFGRTVKWHSPNGSKRWLDVPFTVPESTESPHRVLIELIPRVIGEGRPSGDGLVAVDSLEVYAVSSIEFTERKLVYESEKAKHWEELQRAKSLSQDAYNRHCDLVSLQARFKDPCKISRKFDREQAALLTMLNAIDVRVFHPEPEIELLLLEVNNLWSAVFKGSSSRDPLFLDSLIRPCLKLCTGNSLENDNQNFSTKTPDLLSHGAKMSLENNCSLMTHTSALGELQSVEKLLFTAGGFARSLLSAGSAHHAMTMQIWLRLFDEHLLPSSTLEMLLEYHFALSGAQRNLYRSLYATTSDVVDIALAQTLRAEGLTQSLRQETPVKCWQLVVKALCSMDQRIRLCIGQRVTEVLNSVMEVSQLVRSPFETMSAVSFGKCIPSVLEVDIPSRVQSGSSEVDDDSDSAQRWAYRCDSCGEVCDQEWWHCTDCEDFDLCTKCLRSTVSCVRGTHQSDHMLLRGTTDDVHLDQDDYCRVEEMSVIAVSLQKLVGNLVDYYLHEAQSEMNRNSAWRFLDGAEIISRLIGEHCPAVLRETRLESLHRSSFMTVLYHECEAVGTAVENSTEGLQSTTKLPHTSELLFLMLRILASTRFGSSAAFLHNGKVPELLFRFVERTHGKVTSLARILSSGRNLVEVCANGGSILAWELWNKPILGVSYDILSFSKVSEEDDVPRLFRVIDELGYEDSLFINLLVVALDVLEYTMKSAWSSLISAQMQCLPRNVLCDIINCAESSSAYLRDSSLMKELSAASTRVLSALSLEDDNTLNNVLDRFLYEEQMSRLKITIKHSCGTGKFVMDYDTNLEVARILTLLHKAAAKHPETWQRFVIDNSEVPYSLHVVSVYFGGEVRLKALQMLGTGMADSVESASRAIRSFLVKDLHQKTCAGRTEDVESAECLPGMKRISSSREKLGVADLILGEPDGDEAVVSCLQGSSSNIFDFLVSEVMLEEQQKLLRVAAANILIMSILDVGNTNSNGLLFEVVYNALLKGLNLMPYAGELADGFVQCLKFFIVCCQRGHFGKRSEALLRTTVDVITSSLKSRSELLISHPNSRLYGRLSNILDLSGYYLEIDPCMPCSSAMCDSSELKDFRLDTIRAETKYTDSSIMHRLLTVHKMSALSVKVIDPRRRRMVKRIAISYSSRVVQDAAELKGSSHPWKKLKHIELGSSATDAHVDLAVPVALTNIKFEFVEFHNPVDPSSSTFSHHGYGSTISQAESGVTNHRSSSSGPASDSLQCPRCSRSVTDRHGICRNCHENAYQCRQCRNINYENLDGFLCNECGYCKHGRFEFSITGKPTFVAEPVLNEDDRMRASKLIEKETTNVHRCMDQLAKLRSSVIRCLNLGVPVEDPREKTRHLGGTRMGLADLLDSVAPRSDIAVLEALLEGQTPNEVEEAATSQGGISITEEVIAESSGSADPSERDQNNTTGSGPASPVNRTGRSAPRDTSVINRNTNALATTYARDCRSIYANMSRGIKILSLTRVELVRYANSIGGYRLEYAKEISSAYEHDGYATENLDQPLPKFVAEKNAWACFGCTQAFISNCVSLIQIVLEQESQAATAIRNSDLARSMVLVCSLCEKDSVRDNIREFVTHLVKDSPHGTNIVCAELSRKLEFCINSFETVDSHTAAKFEMSVLEATAVLDDDCWEERLRLVMRILFTSSKRALSCSSVAESIILPCLRVALKLMRTDPGTNRASGVELGSRISDAATITPGNSHPSEFGETENNETGSMIVEDGDTPDMNTVGPALSRNLSRIPAHVDTVNSHETFSIVASGPMDDSELRSSDEQEILTATDDITSGGIRYEHNGNERQLGALHTVEASQGSGTAIDDQLSNDAQSSYLDVLSIRTLLQKDHDSSNLSADVDRWLNRVVNQSAWISNLKLRSAGDGMQLDEQAMPAQCSTLLVRCFQKWRRLCQVHQRDLETENAEFGSECISSNKLVIGKENWIIRLMLFTPCATVRSEACTLVQSICGQEKTLQLQFLDILSGPALSSGAAVGEKSKEYFDLLEKMIQLRDHRLYLIAKKFLPRLGALVRRQAERLIMSEAHTESSLRIANFHEGYALKRILFLLRHTLEAIPSHQESLRQGLFQADDYKLVWSLERAYVCVRKLISLRTKLTDQCASQICEVLSSRELLFSGCAISAVVSACVAELRSAKLRNDAQAIAIVLEQLCMMLCPERKEPVCFIALNKAPTQEEFIRGSMSRNPYPSSSFEGPLMRDVKNKICRDLDLPGLLEDDFAMELLVAGNLIKLDLPIMTVYEHIWRGSVAASMAANMQPTHITRAFGLRRPTHPTRGTGHVPRPGGLRNTILAFRRINTERDPAEDNSALEPRPEPPMIVVYRLSGLDGEATEPIIDSVPVETGTEQDGEELYRDTVVFGEVGGLELLFELLSVVGSWGDDAERAVRAPALRLLRASCEVARNRTLLAKSPDAVKTLLDCAASAFEHGEGNPTAVVSAESLLIAAEQILAQQREEEEVEPNTSAGSVGVVSDGPEEIKSRVQMFLGRLSVASLPKAEDSILHLLPFLIQGTREAVDVVLDYFHFSWENIDFDEVSQQKARQFGTVLLATPSDSRGDMLAEKTISVGIGAKLLGYITTTFPIPRSSHKREWNLALRSSCPNLVLRIINGLGLFFDTKQGGSRASSLLRGILLEHSNTIPVLCQLEMAVSADAIGTAAEDVLEALAKDSSIREEIEAERLSIKMSRREAAEASRQAIMHEAGLRGSNFADEPVASSDVSLGSLSGTTKTVESVLQIMEDLPDEIGPSCVVCGDGFRCRPEEALALYVYSRKVPLDLSAFTAAKDEARHLNDKAASSRPNSSRADMEFWSSGRNRSSLLQSRSASNSCYSTVTHMNAIHLSCHKEAARVDRTSRRDEWDGASLRNSQTRCNNLFPVRPPETCTRKSSSADSSEYNSARISFSAAVDSYFGRLSSIGRTSLSHAKSVTYDLGRCLLRFADGGTAVFSEYSKGGGPHSNACLLPHLVQLAIYMVEVSPRNDTSVDNIFTGNKSLLTQEATLVRFLDEDEPGDLTYYLASSLVLHTLEEWENRAVAFLRRGLRDRVLNKATLFRLIVFADLVNRAMKQGVVKDSDEHWLVALRSQIGSDEIFPQQFGDAVNESWETYVRGINDEESLLNGIVKNVLGDFLELDNLTYLSGVANVLVADVVSWYEALDK